MPSPSPGGACQTCIGSFLADVSAVTATDAWAVGYFTPRNPNKGSSATLALHWNGLRWTHVPTPSPDAALGAGSGLTSFNRTWMLHWDGAQWSRVPVPDPGSTEEDRGLNDVAATSASNAWAVGSSPSGIVLLHWNGSQWTQQPVSKAAA